MIGVYLRELRMKKGYSLTKLAELAGVSKSYLSYIERDLQINPSLQFLSKIAIPLGVTVDHFLLEDHTQEVELDSEWQELLQKAIDEGLSKKDFLQYSDFIKYVNWKKETGANQKSE